MEWIIQNKEWIFSGIGVFILGIIWAIVRKMIKSKSVKMNQKSGSNSTNIQIGRDFKNEK